MRLRALLTSTLLFLSCSAPPGPAAPAGRADEAPELDALPLSSVRCWVSSEDGSRQLSPEIMEIFRNSARTYNAWVVSQRDLRFHKSLPPLSTATFTWTAR